MITFFALPTDLQIHIFQTWLRDSQNEVSLVKALVSLDVACCNIAVRPQYLFMARLSSSCIAGNDCSNARDRWQFVRRIPFCLRWLSTRQVALPLIFIDNRNLTAALLLDEGDACFTLPFVKTIELGSISGDDVEYPRIMLRICPNVACVVGVNGSDATPAVWQAIGQTSSTAIRSLSASYFWLHVDHFTETLSACGRNLQELRIPRIPLPPQMSILKLLAIACPHLQILELHANYVTTADIVEFVGCCKGLRELSLKDLAKDSGDAEDVLAMLRAIKPHHSLKKFSIKDSFSRPQVFADILEQHAWLDVVQQDGCIYDRPAGYLQLEDTDVDTEGLTRIVNACCIVISLRVCLFDSAANSLFVRLVGDKFGHSLTDLAIDAADPNPAFTDSLQYLLSRSPMLKTARISAGPDINDQILQLLVKSCKFLQCFHLSNCSGDSTLEVTDNGMLALLAGCRNLVDVKLVKAPHVTLQTLRGIVNERSLLQSFRCIGKAGFDHSDVGLFYELAKEQQLLPVPKLALRKW